MNHPFSTPQICCETLVAAPLELVFEFHTHPRNILLLHRNDKRLRLLSHDQVVRVGAQLWVEYNYAGFVPVVMGFEHNRYEPPHRFAEAMIHGPFDDFVHTHEFETSGAGTVVRDRIQLALPWKYGGIWALGRVIIPALREVFARRSRCLQQLAAAGLLGRSPDDSELGRIE